MLHQTKSRPVRCSTRAIRSTRSHGRKGSMCPREISGQGAQKLLDESVFEGEKRYATDGEHAYCAQEHREGLRLSAPSRDRVRRSVDRPGGGRAVSALAVAPVRRTPHRTVPPIGARHAGTSAASHRTDRGATPFVAALWLPWSRPRSLSLERLSYDEASCRAVYASSKQGQERTLSALSVHVPDRGTHSVLCYGRHAKRTRGNECYKAEHEKPSTTGDRCRSISAIALCTQSVLDRFPLLR